MGKVLVTDAELRPSLSVIRSLGKRGIKITAASERKSAMGFFSRYTDKRIIYPNPRLNPESFLKHLLNIIKKDKYDFIISSHVYTYFLISKYGDIFSDFVKLTPPDFETFYNVYDKKRLIQLAMKNGVDCPKTYFSSRLDDILSNVDKYPVVIKPSRRHAVKIKICNTALELKEGYKNMTNRYGPCIIQEFIPNGGEIGVYTLFDLNSEPVALTVKKRIRTRYSYGGASTLRETVKNEDCVNIALNLLKKIKWSGLAMVEFRIDSRDGKPKLMEINPRFWGSLQLSISSGVDFPYLLYQLMMKDNVTRNLGYKEGIKGQWLLGDIINIKNFLKNSNKSDIIKSAFMSDIHFDVVSLADPLPGIISVVFPIKNHVDEENRQDNLDITLKDTNEKNNT